MSDTLKNGKVRLCNGPIVEKVNRDWIKQRAKDEKCSIGSILDEYAAQDRAYAELALHISKKKRRKK